MHRLFRLSLIFRVLKIPTIFEGNGGHCSSSTYLALHIWRCHTSRWMSLSLISTHPARWTSYLRSHYERIDRPIRIQTNIARRFRECSHRRQ
jgi:hypothetical protein